MNLALSVVLLGTCLVFAPRLALDGGTLGALALVPAGVILSAVTSGGRDPLPIALGALGGLGYVALFPLSPVLAGAVLVAFSLGTRAMRARSPRARGAYALGAFASGLAGAWLAARFAHGGPVELAAAALVAGVLASVVAALPADDAVTRALLDASEGAPEPLRTRILSAAFLRRRADASREGLDPRTRATLEASWRALSALTSARAGARAPSASVLDARISAHLEALERAYAAADERVARAGGLTDQALAGVTREGEALAVEAAALAEVSPLHGREGGEYAPRGS